MDLGVGVDGVVKRGQGEAVLAEVLGEVALGGVEAGALGVGLVVG